MQKDVKVRTVEFQLVNIPFMSVKYRRHEDHLNGILITVPTITDISFHVETHIRTIQII